MIYLIHLDEPITPIFRHLHPLRKQKIKESLKEIAKDPFQGKPLQEDLNGFYTYRVGSFRIVYSIQKKPHKIVRVVAMGPRESIYEDLVKDLYQ